MSACHPGRHRSLERGVFRARVLQLLRVLHRRRVLTLQLVRPAHRVVATALTSCLRSIHDEVVLPLLLVQVLLPKHCPPHLLEKRRSRLRLEGRRSRQHQLWLRWRQYGWSFLRASIHASRGLIDTCQRLSVGKEGVASQPVTLRSAWLMPTTSHTSAPVLTGCKLCTMIPPPCCVALHCASLAQRSERRSYEPAVEGSIPP